MRRLVRKAGRVALNCVFVAMMASVVIMLAPAALGFQRYVILTGSMTGTYDRGSIVFDRPIPTADLKVGDPITYAPPPGFTSQKRVTHRIWSITRGAEGQRVFRTKGDANKHPDVWEFTLNQPTQDVVVFHVPDVGYVFTLLSLREFRIVLIGLPALFIGFVILRGLWREGGEEQRRQKLAELGWKEVAGSASEPVLPALSDPDTEPQPVWLDLGLAQLYAGLPQLAGTDPRPAHARTTLHVRRLVSSLATGASGAVDALALREDRARVGVAGNTAAVQLRVARLRALPEAPRASAR